MAPERIVATPGYFVPSRSPANSATEALLQSA
jgi:hypothetical protein